MDRAETADGTANQPTHFILLDPIKGKHRWTSVKFRANWATFHNTGVLVR